MSLQVTGISREFTIKKDGKSIKISDPNPEMSPEDVIKFYSSTYPELTNAIIEGPKVDGDVAIYTFNTKAGKLG